MSSGGRQDAEGIDERTGYFARALRFDRQAARDHRMGMIARPSRFYSSPTHPRAVVPTQRSHRPRSLLVLSALKLTNTIRGYNTPISSRLLRWISSVLFIQSILGYSYVYNNVIAVNCVHVVNE